jgi:hypothetical protein
MNRNLLATSRTEAGIKRMIADYYCAGPDSVALRPQINGTDSPTFKWDVYVANAPRPRLSVELRGGVYRFFIYPERS